MSPPRAALQGSFELLSGGLGSAKLQQHLAIQLEGRLDRIRRPRAEGQGLFELGGAFKLGDGGLRVTLGQGDEGRQLGLKDLAAGGVDLGIAGGGAVSLASRLRPSSSKATEAASKSPPLTARKPWANRNVARLLAGKWARSISGAGRSVAPVSTT